MKHGLLRPAASRLKAHVMTPSRVLLLAGLASGLCLSTGYIVWLWMQPRGLQEFAYAPYFAVPALYNPMRGFTYEQWWGQVMRVALLGPGLLLLTWALVHLRRRVWRTVSANWVVVAVTASLLITAILMLIVLRGRAIIDDELSYSMQAEFLGDGRLQGGEIGVRPLESFSVKTVQGYSGKYLPGEPIVQVLGVLVGIPALLHLPILALTLWAWYGVVLQSATQRMAQLATMALAVSPMLTFTSATGLSHATALLCVVLAGRGLVAIQAERRYAGAVLLASAIGFGMLTRPQSVLPAGIVLIALALRQLLWKRHWWASVWLLACLLLWTAPLLMYNQALTGSPFRLPWFLQCDAEHFGFGRVWSSRKFEHDRLGALFNLAVVAVRFNAWWLGAPWASALVPLWFCTRRRSYRLGPWFVIGALVVLLEAFYYSPGVSDTGPVYHYELLLPGSILVAGVVEWGLVWARAATVMALVVQLLGGTLSWTIEQGLRVHRLVDAIHRDSDVALAQIAKPALVLYETWPSESEPRGWVSDALPRRYRASRAAIVTFPRMASNAIRNILRQYPGRTCWYYRRHPESGRAEIRRCVDAIELLSRPVFPTDPRLKSRWIDSSAYLYTDYDPMPLIASEVLRDSQGLMLLSCCKIRELEASGALVPPSMKLGCIPDGSE